MVHYTLIMTRTPLREVNLGKRNGRWGKMILVKGARVLSGSFSPLVNHPNLFSVPILEQVGQVANAAAGMFDTIAGKAVVKLGFRALTLETEGGGNVEVVKEFETLERFRTNNNKNKFYVQLKPRPHKPYGLKMELNGKVKKTFERELKDKTKGPCFRVTGHNTKNGNGANAGILIHEAPQPGFLIGCIAPRRKNDWYIGNDRGGAWNEPMNDIFKEMGGFVDQRQVGQLLVMDW